MQDIVTYLRDYSDRFHHPREDVAFARLAKHCPDLELVLARLGQEHRVIAHAGETLLEQLRAILGGAVVPRAEVEVAAATYLVYYGNHIAKEEEDVLTRAAKELTPEDWEAVRDAVKPGPRSAVRRRRRGALPRTAPPDRAGALTLSRAARCRRARSATRRMRSTAARSSRCSGVPGSSCRSSVSQ